MKYILNWITKCSGTLQKLPIIEEHNNLRINVFGYEEDGDGPLYIPSNKGCEVMTDDGEKQHCCLIRNVSSLFG